MGDRQRFIRTAFLSHSLSPNAMCQVCPVIVTFHEVVPGFFEFIFPFAQAKEGIEGGNSDLYPIVEVGPGKASDVEQFIADFYELGFQGLQVFQGFFFVATAFVRVGKSGAITPSSSSSGSLSSTAICSLRGDRSEQCYTDQTPVHRFGFESERVRLQRL